MDKELLLTRTGIVFCLFALGAFYLDVASAVRYERTGTFEAIVLAVLITALVYGSLVYLLARCGHVRRTGSVAQLLDKCGRIYDEADVQIPHVCVLIPSYKEEIGVLRQTIVSAALAEYPSRRVVVLIDDPVTTGRDELAALKRTRQMIVDLQQRFRWAAIDLTAKRCEFDIRKRDRCDVRAEAERIAKLYEGLAAWVRALGEDCRVRDLKAQDHTDNFFVESIIDATAESHAIRAAGLRASASSVEIIEKEYRRLTSLLNVDIASFERKQFENLSHAPNKAMNLNSYIGLMGSSFRIINGERLPRLQQCAPAHADLVVPSAKYLLTLDADSLVLPNYIMTLVGVLEDNDTIAVAQTPYSAVPGSRNRLERAAGAQTDVQYMIHQGFTAFNATYWVGANALLRLAALRDIRTTVRERGNVVPVFIQDRTVIEDTGSTIDLIRRGWRLHNHQERLAYSATPPDFGSLIIQRRRWSNGGLIIFPDLLRHALTRSGPRCSGTSELLMRAHYLCSPALVGVSVLLLLVLPWGSGLESPWIAATAMPYYALYARDLRQSHYRWRELPQVYALGLMLLPVNLAGVLRSVQQIVTGRKSAFGRTPKVEDRTPTPALHVFFQLAFLVTMGMIGARYALSGHYYLSLFCFVNCALMGAGIALFIGPRDGVRDLLTFSKPRFLQERPRIILSRSAVGPGALQPGRDKDRILGLDGLRAYAISLVFLVHFISQYFNGSTGSKRVDFDAFRWAQADSAIDLLAYYFWASHYGVDLFFLLSGFLIFKLISRETFRYPGFLRNRFMRLYPAFAVALFIYCVYVAYFWGQTHDWFTIVANLLMLQGVWELAIKPIIVPTWSLTFEWLFYLAFPLILLLPSARNGLRIWHLAIVGAIFTAATASLGPHYIRFLMFLGGAALASVSSSSIRAHLQRIPDWAVLFVYGVANLLFVYQQDYRQFIPVYLLTSFLLVAKVIYGNGVLHRIFRLDALRRLGAVSYSFYLFHGLVIIIICDHLTPLLRGLPELVRFTALLGCSFACSAAVASVFYRLLERPYFERRAARLSLQTTGAVGRPT